MNNSDETRHENVLKGMKDWELGTVYKGKNFVYVKIRDKCQS